MAKSITTVDQIKRSHLHTPYYQIQIYDDTGEQTINLPDSVQRLIKKVSIYETNKNGVAANDSEEFHDVISIEIIEGSREPIQKHELSHNNFLYPRQEFTDHLKNTTGSIIDLKFPVSETQLQAAEAKFEQLLHQDTFKAKYGDFSDLTLKESLAAESISTGFVFEYGNKLVLTWGYVTSNDSNNKILTRKAMGTIVNVETSYSENGQISTKITAYGTSINFAALKPSVGKTFNNKFEGFINDAASEGTGVPAGSKEDIRLSPVISSIPYHAIKKELLQPIPDKKKNDEKGIYGINLIIDPELDGVNKIIDAQKRSLDVLKPFYDFIRLTPGRSLMSTLVQIANKRNAVLDFIEEPETNKITIYLISKKYYYSIVQNFDYINLFDYKNAESIIKSVTVGVDFKDNGQLMHSSSSISADGKSILNVVDSAGKFLSKSQRDSEAKKVLTVHNKINKAFLDGTGTNSSTVQSSLEEVEKEEQNMSVESVRIIDLSVKTIGFPYLIPGLLRIKGLGSRYSSTNSSGSYKIISVLHTIDESGYTTTAHGTQSTMPGVKTISKPVKDKNGKVIRRRAIAQSSLKETSPFDIAISGDNTASLEIAQNYFKRKLTLNSKKDKK